MDQLATSQMADFVQSVRQKMVRNKWTDLTTDLQEMVFLPMLFKQEVIEEQGGSGMRWNIMKSLGGTAKDVGLYGVDTTNRPDIMTQGHTDWRHTQASWCYDEREERLNNAGPEQLFDIVDTLRANCQIDLAKHMETRGWSRPGPTSDLITPFGIPYWIVKWPAGTPAPEFTGGNPIANDGSAITTGAGNVSSGTYPRWANWAGQAIHATEDDLMRKIMRALRKTHFVSPVSMPNYQRGEDRFGLYTTLTWLEDLEVCARKRNDNLGSSLTVYMGEVMIAGRSIKWVPQLDNLTGDIFYGINWSLINIGFQRGENMRESGPYTSSENHRVRNYFFDCTWNTKCEDRRRHFVLSTHSSTDTTE